MNIKEVNFWYWVVKLLPKKLVYFCFMHVGEGVEEYFRQAECKVAK